jgi:hypothetical protein
MQVRGFFLFNVVLCVLHNSRLPRAYRMPFRQSVKFLGTKDPSIEYSLNGFLLEYPYKQSDLVSTCIGYLLLWLVAPL